MNKKRISFLLISTLYIVAGINHFIQPLFYVNIMPHYFPIPLELVYISGVCEITLGALILFKKTRKIACYLIVAMLITFLPVHVQMIIDNYELLGFMFWISVIRIPLQYILIKWALAVSKY